MDEGRLGRGQPHLGEWLGDCEDLVGRKGGDGSDDGREQPVGRRWNPIVYRCAFCGESFVSRAMIRRHLEGHRPHDAAGEGTRENEPRAV